MRRWHLLAAGLTIFLALAMISRRGRVRLSVVGLKLTGRLPDVGAAEVWSLVRPHSGFDLDGLVETRNPRASLRLPHQYEGDSAGARLFETRCSSCHGLHAEGRIGPGLAEGNRRHGTTDWATFRVMRDGAPGTAMPPSGLGFEDSWRVIAHLHLLLKAANTAADAGGPAPESFAPVLEAELAGADSIESEWLEYSGGRSGRRSRRIPELTSQSVQSLRLAWAYQLPADPPSSQSTPLALRGLVLVTSAQDVIALNQDGGQVVWRYHRELPTDLTLCCSRANRGVAVLGDRVYVGTLDAHLVALDLATGYQRWDVEVASRKEGYSITSAPIALGNRIVIGAGGGEFGVRGFIDAYDPDSGKRLWRFHTIPPRGEAGSETWKGAVEGAAGGAVWVPGAYDPERHLLYWGVGNPSPDFAPELRPGDNLYTNCVVALDVESGRLKWHYQFTPNDSHDWDAAQTPILTELPWQGRTRSVVLWANRNGFFYVLDRDTGEFLRATPFVRQNWSDGFDAAGRPRLLPDAVPDSDGSLVYPGIGGATSWWPATYSDSLGLLFVAVREDGSFYFRERDIRNENGQLLAGRTQPVPGENYAAAVIAIDVHSGAVRWRTPASAPTALMGGLLSIGDRLILGGQGDTFFALDARTGKRIWQTHLGASIQGAPIVFRTGGTVRVALTAGSVLFVFELPAGSSAGRK